MNFGDLKGRFSEDAEIVTGLSYAHRIISDYKIVLISEIEASKLVLLILF